jgi:circadian clock protein KaiB
MDRAMTNAATFKFKLYIATNTQNSAEAMANLLGICHRYLAGRHEIEVIDVQRHQQRALADGINMTPSLVKFSPAPFRKIVGTLTNTKRVLVALDLQHVSLEQDAAH